MEWLLVCIGGITFGSLLFAMLQSRQNRILEAERAHLLALLSTTESELAQAQQAIIRLETQAQAEKQALQEKERLLESAKSQLSESFKALSANALAQNNQDFLKLAQTIFNQQQVQTQQQLGQGQKHIEETMEPVGTALHKFNERITKIEQERAASTASLNQQLQQLAQSHQQLSQSTHSLVQALRAPQVRGQWGELQLRRSVEMAGMLNYCDFSEQANVEDANGRRQRPDMLIHLPNERSIVVDAKVPLAAYLDALQSNEAAIQSERMQAHARQLREHVKALSAKAYWHQFESSPEFVVLFIPSESIFSAALEQAPDLIELGVANQVIIATPTTLIALLKAIAYGWQQAAVAREAKEISQLGKELHERIGVVMDHFNKLGKSLDQSVAHFNGTARSLQSRLTVTAKKFEALDSASGTEVSASPQIERLTDPLIHNPHDG
jgi:DNA recombination protein RmuC